MIVPKVCRRPRRRNAQRAWDGNSRTGSRGSSFGAGMVTVLMSSFFVMAGPAWAAREPDWPHQCLRLHEELVEPAFVRRYSILFDGQPAGYETFCVVATDTEDIVFQWTSNAIHKFLGSTTIRHCRREAWRRSGTTVTNPRQRLELREMRAWTNVASDGTHSLAAFLDQVPDPSSIRAVRRPDGTYRYILMNLNSEDKKEDWSVRDAALRTPWTESMVPAASINLMDPVRYRVSRETKVVAHEADPSISIPHRRYRVAGPDFAFDLTFRADDGTLLKMDGMDASAHVQIVLVEDGANNATCPYPQRVK